MKRSPLNKTRQTPLAALKRKADKLAGDLCRKRNKCASCGKVGQVEWAHVIPRSQTSLIRWESDNALPICTFCHRMFTDNPNKWSLWIDTFYPGLRTRLLARIVSLQHLKINKAFMENVIDNLK